MSPRLQRSLAEWWMLGEAGLLLVLARIALKTVPMARIVSWVRRPMHNPMHSQGPTADLQRVRWAVTAFSRNVPIRLVCFPQALAMHAMLRRRGIASEILYGAARAEGKLTAHAWLRVGERVWLGGEVSSSFSVLDVWKPAEETL